MSMPSISEDRGLSEIRKSDRVIYSVGISTGGTAEMLMALSSPERKIIATTIDREGAQYAEIKIKEANLQKQVEVKVEDVSKLLPYQEGYFDFIYARLILHYLPRLSLIAALRELHRILKERGRIFAVVRSIECNEAVSKDSVFDPITGMTTYRSDGKSYSRYFHSINSIQEYMNEAGFRLDKIDSYQEQLCVDFKRTQPAKQVDALIEVLATK